MTPAAANTSGHRRHAPEPCGSKSLCVTMTNRYSRSRFQDLTYGEQNLSLLDSTFGIDYITSLPYSPL